MYSYNEREYYAAHCPITLEDFASILIDDGININMEIDEFLSAYAKMRWKYAAYMIAEKPGNIKL